MGYITAFCIGVMSGFVATAILTVGNSLEKMTDAYNKGFEDGRTYALNNEDV